jgi:hypothetical protein
MEKRPICLYCRVPIDIEAEQYIIRNKGQEPDHSRWESGYLHYLLVDTRVSPRYTRAHWR